MPTVINTNSVSGIVSITSSTTGAVQFFNSTGTQTLGDVNVSSVNSGPLSGDRNRIINGAMEIDQRYGGVAISYNNTIGYLVDRWNVAAAGGAGTGISTAQQVTDAPTGLRSSLKYIVTNAKSPAASDQFGINQNIEGLNIIDFAYGTSSAKTVTLSFWVKCSLTGTFSGSLRAYNGTTWRSYVFNYTITSANTWQYITVTAVGDTGQVPSLDINVAFSVSFDLGNGSTYQTSTLNSWQTGNYVASTTGTKLISTLNATFQVTGVQLEIGSVATPFERRNYAHELVLCQRYFQGGIQVFARGTTGVANGFIDTPAYFSIPMHNPPTLTPAGSITSNNVSTETADNITISGFRYEIKTINNAVDSYVIGRQYYASAEI